MADRHEATITEKTGFMPPLEGRPPLLIKEQATLDCGCAVHIGLRADNHEAAIGAVPCDEKHTRLMERFVTEYARTLEAPSDVRAVEVAALVLEMVAND